MSIDMRADIFWGIDAEAVHEAFSSWRNRVSENFSFVDFAWQDYYAHRLGITWEQSPSEPAYVAARDEAAAACGCVINEHGYLSAEPLYYAAVAQSVRQHDSPWGWKLFDFEPVRPEWGRQMRQFTEVMGISPCEPAWRLAACYY